MLYKFTRLDNKYSLLKIELERIRRESLSVVKTGDSVTQGPFSTEKKGRTSANSNDQVPAFKLFNRENGKTESGIKLQKDDTRQKDIHGKAPISEEHVPAEVKDVLIQVKDDGSVPSSKFRRLPTITHQATNFFDGYVFVLTLNQFLLFTLYE